jgi:predicted PurR-regulated permease PerM
MKPKARAAIIVLLPFVLMILINESIRSSIKERPFKYIGFKTMNSDDRIKNKCTWNCHNRTSYCKSHHLKFLKQYISFTDEMYKGEIYLLRSTGKYELANIAILVIFIPFLIFYFLIKGLNIRNEIKKIKQNA